MSILTLIILECLDFSCSSKLLNQNDGSEFDLDQQALTVTPTKKSGKMKKIKWKSIFKTKKSSHPSNDHEEEAFPLLSSQELEQSHLLQSESKYRLISTI